MQWTDKQGVKAIVIYGTEAGFGGEKYTAKWKF